MEKRLTLSFSRLAQAISKSPLRRDTLFVVLLLFYCAIYDYPAVLKRGIFGFHQWRQSDGLSIAMSYYERQVPFHQPRIYAQIEKDGHLCDQAVGEFPLFYYITSKIWQVTGPDLRVLRLLHTAVTLIGLYFLYKLAFLLLRSLFWAYVIPLHLFSSPVLVRYTNNFLPDAPALGLALIGLYFYFLYHQNRKPTYAVYSAGFYLLAGLLKITALLSFIGILAAETYKFYSTKNIRQLGFFILLSLFPLGLTATWYLYAKGYGCSGAIFLVESLPIWNMSFFDILSTLNKMLTFPLPASVPIWNFIAYGLLIFYLAWNWRRIPLFYVSLTGTILGGVLLFVILFFQRMDVHDYYLINTLICMPLLSLTFVKSFPEIAHKRAIKLGAFLLLLLSTWHAALANRLQFNFSSKTAALALTMTEWEKGNHYYHYHLFLDHYQALEEIGPHLEEKFGIQKNDLIVSLPDPSPNITLFLLRRRGFTNFWYGNFPSYAERLAHFRQLGAKYLILNDTTLLNEEGIRSHIDSILGRYRNAVIAKLR
ncbi:MAG: hypothetical protein KatS3mg026_0515 [Bacteroidia bacterium]|nr:MAG: hypothetical protein KatS3mg026_0515 [Bacteroidia bacterium]